MRQGLSIALLLLLTSCTSQQAAPQPTGEQPRAFASVSTDAWPTADRPRDFVFPRDHGAHPEYQTEWWYYTGHLRTAEGRAFGVQVTFFRRGLVPQPPERTSTWASNDIYMAHFCISDLEAKQFHQAERVSRSGADLAGASLTDHEVHVLDWSIDSLPSSPDSFTPEPPLQSSEGLERGSRSGVRMQLADAGKGMGLELELIHPERVVLHGDVPGLSEKGGPGQASYYYSYPRFPAIGRLTVGGREYAVSGDLWMDHEFGSNQLAADQQGWDWFALQFNDGSAAMLFQIRPADPAGRSVLSGTWIAVDGTVTPLHADDFTLVGSNPWTSPTSNGQYPQVWDVAIPSREVTITVRSRMPNQELTTPESTGITYWEGAVEATGTHTGEGYLEMTGYVENVGARF